MGRNLHGKRTANLLISALATHHLVQVPQNVSIVEETTLHMSAYLADIVVEDIMTISVPDVRETANLWPMARQPQGKLSQGHRYNSQPSDILYK